MVDATQCVPTRAETAVLLIDVSEQNKMSLTDTLRGGTRAPKLARIIRVSADTLPCYMYHITTCYAMKQISKTDTPRGVHPGI